MPRDCQCPATTWWVTVTPPRILASPFHFRTSSSISGLFHFLRSHPTLAHILLAQTPHLPTTAACPSGYDFLKLFLDEQGEAPTLATSYSPMSALCLSILKTSGPSQSFSLNLRVKSHPLCVQDFTVGMSILPFHSPGK